MQDLGDSTARPTVFLFQPQWLGDADRPRRLAHRLVTLLGALRAHGCRVVLAEEAHDGPPCAAWRERMAGADLLVAWCAEMYPGTQIPGLRRFFEAAAFAERPPLVAGGGFFPLIDVAPLALGDAVDGIVLEPGEVILPALLDGLARGRPLAEQAGVCTWSGSGFRANPPPPRRPLPAAFYGVLRELDLERYARHVEPMIFDNLERALQLPTGAGCAKRCTFCFDEQSPYGVFPAAAILSAVRFLALERGLRQILFGELDFFHRRDRALEVVRGLAALRAEVPGLRWFALASVSDLVRWSDGDLDLLRDSGCHRIEVGSESGSAALLGSFGKGHLPPDSIELTRRLTARGVRVTHNLLFGAPGETAADRRATLRLAVTLGEISPLVRLQPRIYQVVPKTTLGAEALRHVPSPPRTLAELEAYRGDLRDGAGRLPWLDAGDERWIRSVVEYLIPMAYEERGPRAPSLLRLLRWIARARCRTGLRLGTALERRAFGLADGEALPGAFVP